MSKSQIPKNVKIQIPKYSKLVRVLDFLDRITARVCHHPCNLGNLKIFCHFVIGILGFLFGYEKVGLGKSPALSTISPTVSSHSMAMMCTPLTPGFSFSC